jgi:uncharacterized cupredoxin-like copper-binding protein
MILMTLGAAFDSGPGSRGGQAGPWGFGPGGMMGFGEANAGSALDPGSPGFVAGTTAAPRVVRIIASGTLRFYPDVVTVRQGETITFEVTAMGMTSHEFMVGPAADVAADTAGTPEVADIAMMQTKSVTFAFNGPGPFAFACHAPGHYEAGMAGTIAIVP